MKNIYFLKNIETFGISWKITIILLMLLLPIGHINAQDTDSDGVIDTIDIDDDNDGILDINEGFCGVSEGSGAGFDVDLLAGINEGSLNNSKTINGTYTIIGIGAILRIELEHFVPEGTQVMIRLSTAFQAVNYTISSSPDGISYFGPMAFIRPAFSAWETIVYNVPAGGATFIRLVENSGVLRIDGLSYTFSAMCAIDSDGDGIPDHLDIDKDNDGITDNVEAQTTQGYIEPSGIGSGITDADGDGLDDIYDTDTGNITDAASIGLIPVDTDGDTIADVLDANSDNEGPDDIVERGDGQAIFLSSTTDTDGDGLYDIFESGSPNDGFDVNDQNLSGTTFNLADNDNDVTVDGSNASPMNNDFDYRDDLSLDFGDSPVSYGDASHIVAFTPTVYLGSSIDTESAMQNSANADGDNNNGINDEDGVSIPTLTLNTPALINISVNESLAGTANLSGWIDWNINGTFDGGEQVASDIKDGGIGDNDGIINGNIQLSFTPCNSTAGTTFARFRFSSTPGLSATTVLALDGEVEDYQITIICENEAPTWVNSTSDLYRSLECNDITALFAAQELFPVAIDNCDSDVTDIVKTSGNFRTLSSCSPASGYYINRWIVTDDCGNTSLEYVQVILVQDTTNPTIIQSASDLIVECDDSGRNMTDINAWLESNGGASATDTCSEITWSNDYNTSSNDCGSVIPITFTATDACGNTVSSQATLGFISQSITKSNTYTDNDGSGDISVDDMIIYTFTVENTGTTSLTGVTVTDDKLGTANLSDLAQDGLGFLEAGAVETTMLTYTVQTTDLGTTITNIATMNSDQAPPDSDSNAIAVPTPSLNITKSNTFEDKDGLGDVSPGDVITYTFTVENTGSASLTGVTVTDDKLGTAVLSDLAQDGVGFLAPGAVETATLTYTVQAGDLGTTISNIGTADSDQTAPINDTNDVAVTTPSLNITKSNTYEDNDGSGDISPGDVITYTFTVENTGTILLTGVFVNDDRLGAATLSDLAQDGVGILAAAAVETAMLTYTIQTSDLGTTITNIAIADSDQTEQVTDTNAISVPAPSLNITKSNTYEDKDGSGDVSPDDIISYTFTVENTGTASLSGVMVTDDKLGIATLSDLAQDGVGNLATGDSETAILTYTVQVSDLGTIITNMAVADSDQTEPDTDTNAISVPTPSLNITKSNTYEDKDGSGDVSSGDIITYTITVENTGTASLSGVTVTDDKLGTATLSDLAQDGFGNLAAGDTETAILTYTVQVSDLGTTITNIASANSNQTEPDTDTNAISVPVPSMSITKSNTYEDIDGSGKITPGDVITYTLTVENTGSASLTGVTVTDDKLGTAILSDSAQDGVGFLAPGAVENIVLVYTVLISDTGTTITNTAIAQSNQTNPVNDSNTIAIYSLIEALDNNAEPADGFNGGDAGINILDNDSLDNIPVNLENVTITSTPTEELTVNSDGSVTIKPGTLAGIYTIDYTICELSNPTNCDSATVTISVSSVSVLNACMVLILEKNSSQYGGYGFSPNGDGINEVFEIVNIELCFPDYKIEIYDRWGNEVFDYQHNGDLDTKPTWWNGTSSGRMTINKREVLPSGTYFYIIYPNKENFKPVSGYVYLTK